MAKFFDDVNNAAETAGSAAADLPRVAISENNQHDPTNPYCRAVYELLILLGQAPGSWRYAVSDVLKDRA